MRMPRMTTRRLMVAVAVVAVLIGAELMRQRWVICRRRAAYHAYEVWHLARNREFQLHAAARNPALRAVLLFDAERYRKGIAWHTAREAENRRVVWRPWEPIPPDPIHAPWDPMPAELRKLEQKHDQALLQPVKPQP
jgi:hypothetical protein